MCPDLLRTWKEHQRYREVVNVCLPLVIGMSAITVMEFTDRIFLANYSLESISAATPAGISAFLFMAFLGGVGSYCAVFIAQYCGSGRPDKTGSVLWQGIYFSALSGVFLFIIAFLLTEPLFALVNHAPAVRILEEKYFSILCKGAVLHVASQTLSSFFIGRGLTRPVAFTSIIGMLINIPLDYALIYGIWIFPELGIVGAGIATVTSSAITVLLLTALIFRKKHIRQFNLYSSMGFDPRLFLRILRFGIPGAMQFSLDILAFTIFIMMVGRIGTIELAATNIVLSINAIAFMPSMGVSQGISILVGQSLGAGKPMWATSATWSAVHLLLGYILLVGLFFVTAPELALSLFIPADSPDSSYYEVLTIGENLMIIVACYLFFDALYMVFSGVLKGAGDTRFLMWSVALCSLFCLILPLWVGIELLGQGIYYSWACVLFFIFTLFTTSSFRFGTGRWKTMLVIESSRN